MQTPRPDPAGPLPSVTRSASGDPSVVVKRRPGQTNRLRIEAQRLTELAGRGFVPLRGVVDDGGEVELHLCAAAGSVADVLAERGRLGEAETRSVGVAAARALARLHDAGLVHADVKPANLLLTNEGELWIADLDAACQADGRPLSRGSPARMRPGAVAAPATDVISLAVSLVELAAGIVPDPSVRWNPTDLVAIDCPPALAADLSAVLVAASPPGAREFAAALGRGVKLRLPEPARFVRRVDPTPTLDFDPVVARPEVRSPPKGADPSLVLLVVLTVIVAAVVGTVLLVS